METTLPVLLIDDHPLLNYGLASCLEETGRFTVAGQVHCLEEARRFMEEAAQIPALVILDILLGEENGLEFLPVLNTICRERDAAPPPVLVCSVLEDPFRIQTALQSGASGYIPKSGGKTELLHAIDTVLGGNMYVSDRHSVKISESQGIYAQLTKREQEVLHLIKQNKTNTEIARQLYISIRTVENHISNMYFKTGCGARQELQKL